MTCLHRLVLSGVILAALAPCPRAQELPSAPSATKQPSRAPAPQQAAPPAQAQPDPPAGQPAFDPPATPPKRVVAPTAPTPDPSPAQDPPAPTTAKNDQTDDTIPTIRTTVSEVNVVFTVTDKHNHFVKDLKQADFNVLDNKLPPEQIRSFSSETNLPLQVGLLIDASNSIRERFKFEQDSAIEFLGQTVRPRSDSAFVIGFDENPEVTQDFTDDTEALARGVRAMRPGGGTALYDAIYFACRDKLLTHQRSGPTRKAIVLLSDGEDNQSHVTREEAIDMAERAEVIIYTISTNITGTKGKGDKVLSRIADATGGRAFFPFQITDVANAFAEIQDELRSQYALSYKPADFKPDGQYHTIEIASITHKDYHVRSRRGYYAPSK
jgi:VWFA-related protein